MKFVIRFWVNDKENNLFIFRNHLLISVFACVVFNYGDTTKIFSCDHFRLFNWTVGSEGNLLTTCYANTAEINSTGFSFSYQKNVSIGAIDMDSNKKIKFLPENPAESFPSIVIYDARNCSIKALTKKNFLGLSSLQRIFLQKNLIVAIDDDTFEDSLMLKSIDLCKGNLSILSFKKLIFV